MFRVSPALRRQDLKRFVAGVGLITAAAAPLTACTSSSSPTSTSSPPVSSGSAAPSSHSSSSATTSITSLLEQGLAAQSQGNNAVAKSIYLKVLKKDPKNKFAHYDLGVIYQQAGSTDQARREYEAALAADSSYKPALFNLATLETQPNPQKAIQLYRKLLKINPNDANVHFNLGLLLTATGNRQGGKREVQEALKLDPSLQSRLAPSSSPTK